MHTALAPTEDELTWARRILEAADGRGAFKLDGEMIDAPVMARAKQFLSLSAWTARPNVDGEADASGPT
ncbi:Citrate lyase subunit beta-like protein [compost metagenome]